MQFEDTFLVSQMDVDERPTVRARNQKSGELNDPYVLVMKGGGVKGLAYVGAIEIIGDRYPFNWFVGTSAGAITAVLLAAGYSWTELTDILQTKDFRDFFDASWWKRIWNIIAHRGLHPADTFTDWIDTLLAKKLKSTTRVLLSDLPYRVTIYASRREKKALRFDSIDDPDTEAAYAVRCSMSIPYYFIPQSHQGFQTYDGGLQNNYPLEDLLNRFPNTPFISLYLGPEIYEPPTRRFVLLDLLSIWTESHDHELLRRYPHATLVIDPRPVETLDFNLSLDEKEFLLECGRAAAHVHFDSTSASCLNARQRRDALKERVVKARKDARRLRNMRRICLALIVIAGLVIWMWPRTPNAGMSVRASQSAPSRAKVTVKFDKIHVIDDSEGFPDGKGDVWLDLDVNGSILRWPDGNDTKEIGDGEDAVVGRSITVEVAEDQKVVVRISGTDRDEVAVGNDNDPLGTVEKAYDTKARWGTGDHAESSAGGDGRFTIYYTISAEWVSE